MPTPHILFITATAPPRIGGVENHIKGVLEVLKREGVSVELLVTSDWPVPRLKFVGLLYIWWQMLRYYQQIRQAQVIFIHDVFIYFLPLRLLLPHKKVITIFHGFEKKYPIPPKNIFYKRLAQQLSQATISIGAYVNQHYRLSKHNNQISYGAVQSPDPSDKISSKNKNHFVFLGRLEKDTGLSIFLDFLEILRRHREFFQVDFLGDGEMHSLCQKYGRVHGFIDPRPFLSKSQFCFASGYLSILEGLSSQNMCLTAYDNQLKQDYLLQSPFQEVILIGADGADLYAQYRQATPVQHIKRGLEIAKQHSFEALAKLYLTHIKS